MGTLRTPSAALLCAFMSLTAGCAQPFVRANQATEPTRDGVSTVRGAVVLSGSPLVNGRGSLLDVIRKRLPTVRLHGSVGSCPAISLRGHVPVQGSWASPDVYVDGEHAVDTCILTDLRAADTQRVEVYPMGFTSRPGYGTNAEGLILVFMRSR